MASFLEKASIEVVDEFTAKSRKAGVVISESRDTPDPTLITNFLTTLLEVNGTRTSTPLLHKRIKDDVCWDDAELPWRRSPLWLVLRVSVQRLLYLEFGAEKGRAQYKFMMCCLLSQLLRSSIRVLSADLCSLLRAKLCRRLAKLENERAAASPSIRSIYTALFDTIGIYCQDVIDIVTLSIEEQWTAFKIECRRRVPRLPGRAKDDELNLALPNSGAYLQHALDQTRFHANRRSNFNPASLNLNSSRITNEFFDSMTEKYFALEEREMDIESSTSVVENYQPDCDKKCRDIASEICSYLDAAHSAYDDNVDQKSTFILNVFDLWVRMDKYATSVFPLLYEYHPCFGPEILDVLLLSRLSDLQRLQEIQLYINARCARAGRRTNIFADPDKGCFADRYFQLAKSKDLRKLQNLQENIENASLKAREAKKKQLEAVNKEYEIHITEGMKKTTCTLRRHADGNHDIRGCTYCWHLRCSRRLKIDVHEDFLPGQESQRKIIQKRAITFELDPPVAFLAYRDATWQVMNHLCFREELASKRGPEELLGSYSQLKRYNKNDKDLSLASKTKSFLGTHYKFKHLPTAESKVLLPLGLDFCYYDSRRKFWASSIPEYLTVTHHFVLSLPKELPFSKLYSTPDFAADSNGPTSYETVASISDCPKGLTVHEYTAHQSLVAGKSRRWFSVLTELASSNVNFSLQDTAVLFNHLALQAGPNMGGNRLRDIHVVFKDTEFCKALLNQIEKHADAISANWREISYMETLLTLTIRLHTLGSSKIVKRALEHLSKIRRITLDWIRHIRHETRTTNEGDAAERKARYGFMASLLCRRTFSYQAYTGEYMDGDAFRDFVIATLAMQENLVVDVARFSKSTRNTLIRDIKMTFRMKDRIRDLAKWYPSSIESAIETIWPTSGSGRPYTGWSVPPGEWWMSSMVAATANTVPQYFRYHLLDGHLLVDGKPLGKLPPDIQNSSILKELFGNQRLVAFPSNLYGMSYVLGIPKNGYHVHIGYRGKDLVIQAQRGSEVLEFIPRAVFSNEVSFDLPTSLISDYVHWLNMRTRNLEIRRKNNIWKSATYGTWVINMETRRATRRESSLVDPRSRVFGLIAQIFRHFAEPHMLIVCQPKGNLYVELKNMDLMFRVNRDGLLECSQLGSLIDPNQDAGTLYGLQSMIVLRDIENPEQRSVVTTIGGLKYVRHGLHVNIKKENDGKYARYMIDNVLGRLHCLPEPLLLYTKAQLHAFTSFVVPDPLTGRTGTEEALRYLKSGSCQPWNPLLLSGVAILQTISNLTPRRHYYPRDLKRQQNVLWDTKLTTTIQHDAYECVVRSIMEKSRRLCLFQESALGLKDDGTEVRTIPHLRERAHWRRSIYERPGILSSPSRPPPDRVYVSRGTPARSARTSNAREILTMIYEQPTELHTIRNLEHILREWQVIGGYAHDFVPYGISDYLKVDLAQEWGGLVNLCRKCEPQDAHDLMFRLGLVAFNDNVDMTVLRTMVAFFLLEDLKTLKYPKFASFAGSNIGKKLTYQQLIDILMPLCEEFEEPSASHKAIPSEKLRIRNSKRTYEKECLESCVLNAEKLMKQWPTRNPIIEKPDALHFDDCMAQVQVTSLFEVVYDASAFLNHINEVQDILDLNYTSTPVHCAESTNKKDEVFGSLKGGNVIVPRLGPKLLCKKAKTIDYFFVKAPRSPRVEETNLFVKRKLVVRQKGLTIGGKMDSAAEISELETINNRFINSDCSVRSTYGCDLNQSIVALKEINEAVAPKPVAGIDFDGEFIKAHNSLYEHHYRILKALASGDLRHHWLVKADLWPCTKPSSLLELLRSNSGFELERGIKDMLIDYGKAIVKLQHLFRMKDALLKGDNGKFKQERSSLGHVNWNPSVYPDWLLLEIEANMQIREDQVTVALEMISPTSGANSVLQMNMGQGKTSVIMPMVACILADKNMLARLLVPKALLSQTAQILQSRLGGLLGREVTHVPFSRRTSTTPQRIDAYHSLHKEMMQSSGVMLAIPEHVLSFKLCGLQRLSDLRSAEASHMVAVQRWMDCVCRDILDECDFTLATKTQLIYPSGAQLPIDGHSYRWKVGETVLGLVSYHLRDLAREFPKSIDIIERNISEFPVAYFLRGDVEKALKKRLVDDVCAGRTSILPIRDCTKEEQHAIRAFISLESVKRPILDIVSRLFPDTPHFRKNVYLLRGLIVHGVLLTCLKKRWNVQYGLHPHRDPVAVPFHAKGVPSEQAEWGHPDVAILFTCLAFYYQGLTATQLRQSLQVVFKSDDPTMEYDQWTQASTTLPNTLRHWNIVNVDDDGQLTEIWKHLRFATVVINHYLNNFVFPAHARQFAIKLQASGWDVPLFSLDSQSTPVVEGKQPGITTGFSGTNDNRRLLPLTIKQRDLKDLSHTNAEVLTYLLQKRNRGYNLAADKSGRRFSECELLGHLNDTGTRILIDAGAFVLEKDNQSLVKEWLAIVARTPAAVYFGPDNKPWVQYRFGNTIPLLATPFADDLTDCLVYLDEAHTRGTDLKLPANAKAALTLGLNQTKDHTVQGKQLSQYIGYLRYMLTHHSGNEDAQTGYDTVDHLHCAPRSSPKHPRCVQ